MPELHLTARGRRLQTVAGGLLLALLIVSLPVFTWLVL
jgi:hypothetical protein